MVKIILEKKKENKCEIGVKRAARVSKTKATYTRTVK